MSKNMGRGPWFVGFLRDRISGAMQTRVHTYCWRIPAILNALNPDQQWYVHRMVGPYDSLADALDHKVILGLQEWKQDADMKECVLRGPEETASMTMGDIRKFKKRRR